MTKQEMSPSKKTVSYEVDPRPLCAGMPFVLTDAAHPRMVLKNGNHFLVLNEAAQIPACNTLGYGYYRHDTRQLSQWELYLNGVPLSLLSSDLHKGYSARFLYTNPQMDQIPQQKITLKRKLVLSHHLWEQISVQSFAKEDYEVELEMKFQNDFADMFEVRGLNLNSRGERMKPTSKSDNSAIYLAYQGSDGILLESIIEFLGNKPFEINDGCAKFKLKLSDRKAATLTLRIDNRMDTVSMAASDAEIDFNEARQNADDNFKQWRINSTHLETANELFNLSIERSINDFYILRQATPKGFGIGAGLPWYASVFGRDSAIAGIQAVPYIPFMARESIEILAAYQGKKNDPFKAEEEGKIMHELRLGELARSGQIPHSPYYGTVDATQLWLILICEYFKWTADLDFVSSLWPAVKAALSYLNKAEAQGGGYIRYSATKNGLRNQGWKDSDDCIMHFDGSLAEEPIAILEAQAYLYKARKELAELSDLMGQSRLAETLTKDAQDLKERFLKDFWMPTERYLCLALDKYDHQVGVISSNAGHALWSGILDREQGNAVADRLIGNDMYSGWGIRTLSEKCSSFNPISYHNGSVWPHDNAIIADGMRKLGRIDDFMKILNGIVEISMNDDDHRLPELLSGFEREATLKPVNYPVSCSPQAWAAGSLLHMLSSCLNFQADAKNKSIRIINPILPEWFETFTLRGLRIGDASLSLAFETQEGATFTKVLRKSGNLKVIVEA
ncbi:MAG: hypothetical protein K2X27_12820 [Candidatus Obscuribacterales bacterium]|nr:hypothetical protein [Candidatus Obscuribacterales bacterium]